jgi:hypothetical protein
MIADEIDALLSAPTFGVSQNVKEARLAGLLSALTQYHVGSCPPYRRMVEAGFPEWSGDTKLDTLPYIPVSVFKDRILTSVPSDAIVKTLTSSGTTGSNVSRIQLDRATANRQTRALAAVLTQVLGQERRPMLIVDSPNLVRDRRLFSARGAGVLGMMNFGRAHTYLLNDTMHAVPGVLRRFTSVYGGQPVLIFGFTFMVWQCLLRDAAQAGADLSQAVLIHSGGWKRLEQERVDNEMFKAELRSRFGITRVYNFYGMVEQVGGVHLEGDDGLLHPPSFGDVIVRNPVTWAEQPVGQPGVLQVLSALPTSYPGHSILTDDLGVVESVDSGRTTHLGKAFRVLGRVPHTELRGCSDTFAMSQRA